MESNLISYTKVTDTNKIVSVGNITKIFNKQRKLIALGIRENNLIKMRSLIKRKDNGINANLTRKDDSRATQKGKWHRTLRHINFNYLGLLCKNELLDGVPKMLDSVYMKCRICIENEMCNLPFQNTRIRAQEVLEIIHTNVNGPHSTVGYKGEKYSVSFIDGFSGLSKVYCIKTKDEVYDCFLEYVNEVQYILQEKNKETQV